MFNTILKAIAFCLIPVFVFGQSSNPKGSKLLVQAAQKSNSDALVVLKDGAKIAEYYSHGKSKKIQSMSVTKSVVGLAIAKLLTEGAIDSLDTPVAHYYPE